MRIVIMLLAGLITLGAGIGGCRSDPATVDVLKYTDSGAADRVKLQERIESGKIYRDLAPIRNPLLYCPMIALGFGCVVLGFIAHINALEAAKK